MQKINTQLKSPHLELAHSYWQKRVFPRDIVIDATAGGGYDSVVLASLALRKDGGKLLIFDIQNEALEKTKAQLERHYSEDILKRIELHHSCHSHLLRHVEPRSVQLIVYNLGYFPGGDKTITTQCSTTLHSVQAALEAVRPGGLVSITCYPGHAEGQREEEMLLEFARSLEKELFLVCFHRFVNREKAPSLLLIERMF
jgi:hypothetical protein